MDAHRGREMGVGWGHFMYPLRVEFSLNLYVTLTVICQKLPVPPPHPLEFILLCTYVKMSNELVPYNRIFVNLIVFLILLSNLGFTST